MVWESSQEEWSNARRFGPEHTNRTFHRIARAIRLLRFRNMHMEGLAPPIPVPRPGSPIAGSVITKIVALLLVGAIAWASLLRSTSAGPVFGDEPGWIAASSREADLFLAGRFDWNLWNEKDFGAYGPMNPPLGKLALGLPLRVGDASVPHRALWDWALDEAGNRSEGNVPPQDLLVRARRIAAAHAALFVVIVCALGWEVGGAGVGLLAAALLCFHPTWREIGPQVLTDMFLNALLLAMAFPAIRWLKLSVRKRGLAPLVLMAFLAGAAGAVKPTGIVLGFLFIASVAMVRAIGTREAKGTLVGAAMAVLVSGATMVAFDPWLWPNPAEVSPRAIPGEVGVALELLKGPDPFVALEREVGRMPSINALARPAWIVVRARNWKNLVAFQKSLPSLQWQRPRLLELTNWIFLRFVSFPGEALFMVAGVWFAIAAAFRYVREGRSGGAAPVLVVLLFTSAALAYTFALVVLPVPRYLLPLFGLLQLLAAFGIVGTLRHVVHPWGIACARIKDKFRHALMRLTRGLWSRGSDSTTGPTPSTS